MFGTVAPGIPGVVSILSARSFGVLEGKHPSFLASLTTNGAVSVLSGRLGLWSFGV